METFTPFEWVERLKNSADSGERRAILQKIEPVLEGLTRVESEVLFPLLRRFVGFSDWMREAYAHHSGFRELMGFAHVTSDHERILDITDDLVDRLLSHLEGIRRILYPRLVQALPREELEDLRTRLGHYWPLIAVPHPY